MVIKRCLFLVLLFVSYQPFVKSQIYSLRFQSVSENLGVFQEKGKSAFTDSASLIQKINETLAAVRSQGYLLAEVEKVEWQGRQATVSINTKDRFNISKISLGDVSEDILDKAGYSSNTLLSHSLIPREIEKLFQSLLKVYANKGYPFVEIGFDSVQIEKNNVSVSLNVEKGRFVVYDTLRIAGDGKVSRRYLESLLDMKEGATFKQASLDAIEERLGGLAFVRLVKPARVMFAGNKAQITLFLEKQANNQFDGVLGFLPDSKTGKPQFVGDLKLHLQNPFKRAEQFDFNYKGLPEKSKELNLDIALTELFSSPFGIELGFNLYKQSNNYQTIHSKASLNYRLPKGRLSFLVQNRSSLVISPDTLSTVVDLANSSSISYGSGFLFQNLNSNIQPRRGTYVSISAESGKRQLNTNAGRLMNLNADTRQYRVNSTAGLYYPLGSKSVLKVNNETGILIGKQLFENELYRIGGFNSIKGFNEQSLLASSYTYFNAEYRLLIEDTSYLFTFFNQGFLEAKTVSSTATDSLLGFGAGINLRVKTGMFSLSYAVGKQKDNPLNLQSGKIHFGLITLF